MGHRRQVWVEAWAERRSGWSDTQTRAQTQGTPPAGLTPGARQDLASGDANLPVTRGGASEAEEALDELEAEILSQLSPAGLAGGGSDDT